MARATGPPLISRTHGQTVSVGAVWKAVPKRIYPRITREEGSPGWSFTSCPFPAPSSPVGCNSREEINGHVGINPPGVTWAARWPRCR